MVLIIVLCCVALLAILIVGFLGNSATEVTASKQFSSAADSQNLAASALNLVMGQVATATAGFAEEGNGGNLNDRISWASQPGMIRTYTTSGTTLGKCYKLYSSGQMEVPGDDFNTPAGIAADLPPDGWKDSPGIYTDLNAPIVSESIVRFPIVDPRADVRISGDTLGVAGFTYRENGVTGAVLPGAADADEARLPMPVKWLYVLKDGRFGSPGSTGTASQVTVNGATKANPIVGRIAFWTDDESCKVNINTAAEGNFWDTPMANFVDEGPLNLSTPASGEYQRYMGHPATTSLSVVFPWLKGSTAGQKDDAFMTLGPRVVSGGSHEGTEWYKDPSPVPPDTDRLYDSVDELAFNQSRLLRSLGNPSMNLSPIDIERRRFFLTAQSRSPEVTLFGTPRVAIWPLSSDSTFRHAAEKLIALAASTGTSGKQYFFTRATRFDSLADFNDASRSGRNAELLGYLRQETSMPIPGYDNKTFARKWGADRDQILIEIYDYIRSCINLRTKVKNGGINTTGTSYTRDVNGPGEVYPTVLPTGTALSPGQVISTDTRGFGRFPTVREVSMLFGCRSDPVMQAPIDPKTKRPYVQNFGWLPIVDPTTQILTGLPAMPAEPAHDGVPEQPATSAVAAKPAKIWPAIIIEMFLPAQGLKTWTPNVKVTVTGLSSFNWDITQATTVGGTTTYATRTVPMFSSDSKVFNAVSAYALGLTQVSTGYTSEVMLYTDMDKGPPFRGYGNTEDPSGPAVDNWKPDFLFNGGTVNITVDLGVPEAAAQTGPQSIANSAPIMPENMRQTFKIKFPGMTKRLPNPKMAWQVTFGGPGQTADGVTNYYATMYDPDPKIPSRMRNGGPIVIGNIDSYAYSFSQAAGYSGTATGWAPQYPDIIKSMVVRHGDYRLVAAATDTVKGGDANNPDNLFVPHAYYFNGVPDVPFPATVANNPGCYARPSGGAGGVAAADINYYNAQNLRLNPKMTVYPQWSETGTPGTASGQGIGQYVLGTPLALPYIGWGWSTDTAPSISPGITAANSVGRQGDWDNGVGNGPDGPFINKVDEGTDLQQSGTATTALLSYLQDQTWDPQYPLTERTFGPMRQIASPVMFGSLPTAVKRNRPWETLLFCPNPAASFSGNSGTTGGFTLDQHPEFDSPPDHLLLDLFWMPVTEPYAISDSFSTAGKINMNYQILPFTYINRDTGMRAILANQKVTAFDESPSTKYSTVLGYKTAWNQLGGLIQTDLSLGTTRWDIDATQTLSQFDTKFTNGEIFKSATQICEMFLVPRGFTLATTMNTDSGFWKTRRLTGDNMRERPYNSIYPRVTTRSNVYTIYVKAQSLKQTKSTLDSSPDTFTEGKDLVQSEFQASYTIERYLDPNAPASVNDTDTLGPYKMRVINQRNLSW